MMSALALKIDVDLSLTHFLAYTPQIYLRFTSGVSPADLLTASMAAGRIPDLCFSA